ncbi:PREDICTED: uncharacterized protein LOC109479834 [Branchiostoma belcheri]|uniref:Uncharacterized protein LOC109479834 n=1 Tax=Branchiostoma belcheri TaxID=7741 RepID=A0A6P5A6J7_BRABE|nr:PREDICTED: uncharacterized protein LOC109479834 [Branchiostoma belcheri]
MKAVLAGRTGTSTDEGGQVKRTSATERLQNLDISSLDGDTAKALLHKILTSLEDVAKMKSSTTTAEEQQNRPKSGSSTPPDEVRRASEILLGMRGVDQSSAATCQDTANAENRHQTGKDETNAPASSDDLASRTKSAISTLADLCTALRDAEPQRIFIPGKTAIRPMPDYCRVIFHPSSPDMDNRKRRARTVFSAQQLKRLEEEYKKCSYPDKERRQSVADATGLTEGCVRIWYQNRRAKDHRLKDSERQREGASVSSTSQPEMPGIISSRPVEPVSRLPPSDTAPPATLNRAEEAAMEALVNLSSTTSAETTASHNPNDSLDSAAQSDEALPDTNIKSSSCKNIDAVSKSELVEQRNVANLQQATAKKEKTLMIQTEHNRNANTKLTPVTDSSTVDKPSDDVRRVPSEEVVKASGATSQHKSQRAMIASLVAQTLKHSEGPDCKRTVVPIAVVNIPIVRVDGSTGEGVDGSGKGSEKMKPVPYVAVATRVPVPNTGEQPGGSKRGDLATQSGEVSRRATAIGIPFQALQFQNQWTKKSSNVNQKHDSSTTVTAKIHPDVLISTAPTITRTATSSSASKVSSLLGFLISDPQANANQLARSSKPTVQDAKPSEKGCGVDKEKTRLPNSQIPSTIVLRLQPRPPTMTAKPCTTAGKPSKVSEKEMGQPTSSRDDFSSTSGTNDRKRKVSEAERVNKGPKVVQTQMWRELTEEKSVAKKSKNITKGSKKASPSQLIQPSTQGNQYGDETREREIPPKETARDKNKYGEREQPKLSTADTKHQTSACTVESGGDALNLKNSHPTTLHYKKGRVCQCHKLQEIIDYCVRKGSETAKIDNSCSTTKDDGSLQRPREGKGQAGEPPRQVPRSGDSVPKTRASGTVRHLKITTPISIATTGRLANVRSFTRSRVPVGSVRAPPVITNTQHGGGFHRPTPASFRHVNFSKKPCPLPATVIPKSTPAATGQLFLNNHQKTAVQLKTRGVRVVVSHPSNTVILPTLPVCTGHTYTSPPTFTRPTVGAVSQRAHPTCGAAAMFRLGSVLKRPNASTFRLPLVMKPVERKTTAATTGYVSSGIRLQPVQNRGQQPAAGCVNRPPPDPQGDGNALRRLQRFTDGFMERHRSSAPSTESRRDDRPPPAKVRRTDI